MIRKLVEAISRKNPWVANIAKIFFGSKLVGNNPLYKRYALNRCRGVDNGAPAQLKSVFIETTLTCNSKCIMCLHGKKAMSGTMPMELFCKLIDECNALGIKTVGLSVYGEPLVDPHFRKRLEYVRSAAIRYWLTTNASLLNNDMAEAMLAPGGVENITFSINGFSKGAYEKIMPGLDRDTTYNNVLNFLKVKERLGRRDVFVAVSCVKTKFNKSEIDEFVSFWKGQKGVDLINVGDLWDRMGEKTDASEIGELGPLHRRGLWLSPCSELWSGRLYVYFDGKVSPCCVDNDLRELVIGDANAASLNEIFNCEKFRQLKNSHLENKRSAHPVCGKCSFHSVW